MSSISTSTNSGIGFFGLLTIAFIVLKLCKVIDWSWWLVLLPMWIGFAIGIIAIIVLILIYFGLKNKLWKQLY